MEVGENLESPKPENTLPASFSAPAMSMAISVSGERSVGEVDISRKKRGRPRKYGPEGTMALALTPSFSSSASPTEFSAKRRGRPLGSGKRQMLAALGEWVASSAGGTFTPHVVTVAAGEDVARRILSFSQQGPRSVCLLSANGSVSNVTLRQPGSSGGTLTYEGRFEILSLSGSFTLTDNDGVRSRTGGISVSLAGPDGRVVGGGVAGLLLAASPIQVVVGSFMPNPKTPKKRPNPGPHVLGRLPTLPAVTEARPISQAPPEEDKCRNPSSMLPGRSQGEGENSGSSNQNTNSGSYQTVGWQVSRAAPEHDLSPDINELYILHVYKLIDVVDRRWIY